MRLEFVPLVHSSDSDELAGHPYPPLTQQQSGTLVEERGELPSGFNSNSTMNSIKVSARKSHRKTRTGCRTCKQRKIKCDEQRPSCHNCIKHSVQCDFLMTQPIGSGVLSHNPSPSKNSPLASNSTSQYDHDHDRHSSVGELPLPTLNLLDLELLHNYVTSTAFTLHTDPAMKTLWRINVPNLAFQHDFVMRGILALSALHIARFKPERRDFYMNHAMQQHQAGLRTATAVLSHVTEENCTAVYLFSAFTLFFTLASPRRAGDLLLVGENVIADWLFLVKGTSFIMEASEDHLIIGPLGPMFLAGRRRNAIREEFMANNPQTGDSLTELQDRIRESCSDPEHALTYTHAIDTLRMSFVFIYNQGPPGCETGDIFSWVFRVAEEYLQLLKRQTQESLAILAYFCVVLRRLDSQWWMEGWSTHLISKIWNLLDEEHRLWIRWPIEEIGWIKPN